MLRPFKISVDLRPGHRRTLLVRDVPACVFWYGFPELTPALTPAAFFAAMDRWERGLLSRAVIVPANLTEDHVARLGRARRGVMTAYLEAVGFKARPADAEERLEFDELVEASADPEDAAFAAWVPRGPIRQMLAATATSAHVAPVTLWRGPISEMLFNCRVAMADELLEKLGAASINAPVAAPRKNNVIPLRAPTGPLRVIDVPNPLTVIGVDRA
ncbi:MAG TPA: hypothetical protein VKA83_09410 [Methylomirabilota bacterium]|nr:hypothetical protein [Methylomirabilota bacterium]